MVVVGDVRPTSLWVGDVSGVVRWWVVDTAVRWVVLSAVVR